MGFINKLSSKNNIFFRLNKKSFVFLVLILMIGLFILAPTVKASLADDIGNVIGTIIGWLISGIGLILVLVLQVLIIVAQYSNFIHAPAVVNGWVTVRDICNMFFVVILLVIAFATILRIENYSYKKWLPKLILMAVLINFSKTICGLLIDVAQIVMLTFVNAFKDIAGGNLIEMMGLKSIVTLAKNSDDIGFWGIVGAYMLGLIYIIIALIVITAMLAMLVMRIVMIWIYTVLSPLAYLLGAFPGGQQYASKWWSSFTKNLIVGPVLAFFIWLSFTAMQGADVASQGFVGASSEVNSQALEDAGFGTVADNTKSVTGSEAGTTDVFIKFIVSIGMLLGGMKIAQEIGGEAAGIAGNVFNKGKGLALAGGAVALLGGKKLLTGDNYLARKATKNLFKADFRPVKIAEAIKANLIKSKHDDESDIRTKGMENLDRGGWRSVTGGVAAGADWADYVTDGFLGLKGISRAVKEITYRPVNRSILANEMTEKSEEITKAQTERDKYITSGDKAAKLKEINELRNKELEVDKDIAELEGRVNTKDAKKDDAESLRKMRKLKTTIGKEVKKNEDDINSKIESDYHYGNFDKIVKDKTRERNIIKEKSFHIAPPQALESRLEYRKSINEAKTKYKDMTNADELLKLFEDAKRRHNKFDQIAILEKLSGDANLNEILKDKGYSSNAGGLYSFLRNMPNDHKESRGLTGFSDNEILRIQNDLGESEERVNHWEMAKMVGMDETGKMVSLVKPVIENGEFTLDDKGRILFDDTEHVLAASAEIMKLDPQKNMTSLNRLAMGGEDGNGVFQISNLGKVLSKIFDESGVFSSQAGRLQNNLAINLSLPHIQDELRKLNISDGSLGIINAKGRSEETGGSLRPGDVLDYIKNIK